LCKTNLTSKEKKLKSEKQVRNKLHPHPSSFSARSDGKSNPNYFSKERMAYSCNKNTFFIFCGTLECDYFPGCTGFKERNPHDGKIYLKIYCSFIHTINLSRTPLFATGDVMDLQLLILFIAFSRQRETTSI
jgi:hypothetical protein